MGVDTKAIIRKDVSLENVKNALESKYGVVAVHNTNIDDYFRLSFKDGNDYRDMSVFTGKTAYNDYQIDGVLLSLGYWGNSIGIMKYLCETFGGYLDENDCDDIEFYPINFRGFEDAKAVTQMSLFTNRVVAKLGYEKLKDALELFNEFKSIQTNL